MSVSEKIELLIREKRSQKIERNPVSDKLRCTSVDEIDLNEREILVAFLRRTDFTSYRVTILQGIVLYLSL